MWKFLVKQQKIEVMEREVIADHQIAFVNLKFTFDGDWKKFHKVVQFSQCDEVYSIVLGFDGTSCKLPAELHAGAVSMSVFGYDAESDTTVRATTVPITLNIHHSGFVGDDDTPIPPTPDLYTQLLQKIAEIQAGVNGKDGLSAYEIAVENGFVGTVSEWLESLKGTDGLPGKDGINGTDGADGHDGTDGKNGKDGRNGTDGENGLSAYELAVQNGYTGTEGEWLSSLKGRNGVDGKTVELRVYNNELQYRWLDSASHDVSMWTHLFLLSDLNGKSAYEVAVENGFIGTEEEWLQSITPDLSPYITRVEVLKIVEDKILSSAPDLSPYVTRVETQKLIESKFQTVESDFASLENNVNTEIQAVKDSVEPVVSQAHWHHNLTLLNSLTSAKIARWDKISDVESELQQFRDSTQYDQQNQNDSILMLENRIAFLESLHQNSGITLFSAGSDAISKYGGELFTIYNNAYNSIADFSANYPHFLSAENDHQIHFSIDDFGWDGVVYVVCTKELNLSENSQISMCYQSGATESGDLYLVPKPERNDVPTSVYVYTQIQNGTAIKIPFQWLQSEAHITTLSNCNVSSDIYYFAFAGRSNNTRPKIKSIKILEG